MLRDLCDLLLQIPILDDDEPDWTAVFGQKAAEVAKKDRRCYLVPDGERHCVRWCRNLRRVRNGQPSSGDTIASKANVLGSGRTNPPVTKLLPSENFPVASHAGR